MTLVLKDKIQSEKIVKMDTTMTNEDIVIFLRKMQLKVEKDIKTSKEEIKEEIKAMNQKIDKVKEITDELVKDNEAIKDDVKKTRVENEKRFNKMEGKICEMERERKNWEKGREERH